ncbi:hypothetical protein BpHYR1_017356 [Brachionus plicatilis]|uniref:Uncharacterized protein n=1 Tax=Brachionus plicatilis TaxID=10195 RepID=A0A3M7QUL1_BRAPC|nr:hypothetical protein BpHYR1_017356 [Brachionus plicatilis]
MLDIPQCKDNILFYYFISFSKGMNLKNNTYLSLIVYKSLIRSNFDYIFIPLMTDMQRIKSDIQKLQNRVLRIIQYFPLKTRISDIHQKLNVDLLVTRLNKLFANFISAKRSHSLIQEELNDYQEAEREDKVPFQTAWEIDGFSQLNIKYKFKIDIKIKQIMFNKV